MLQNDTAGVPVAACRDADGFAAIEAFGVLGDGQSVALVAVVWNSSDGYCVGVANTNGASDRSAPFAAFGYPYRTYFYDSFTGHISTTACPTPSGATGIDGHYIDSNGAH